MVGLKESRDLSPFELFVPLSEYSQAIESS